MYSEWDLVLRNAMRNGTCPICKMEGKNEFSLIPGALKFCSDVHMEYYMWLWYSSVILGYRKEKILLSLMQINERIK